MDTKLRCSVVVLFVVLACARHTHQGATSPTDAGDAPLVEQGLDTSGAKDVLASEGRADGQAEAPARICGNWRRERGEQCDDGNTVSGDGCSSTCQLECGDAGVEPCMDACFFDCTALCCAGSGVTRSICGNGIKTRDEACDDGNAVSGDGCSGDCKQVEPGYHCVPGWPCTPVCGDGVVKAGETCDDGNTREGDGCSKYCLTEPGWDCSSGVCLRVDGGSDGGTLFCGDGIRSGAEECDLGKDNSDSAYGGCNTQCMLVGCGDGIVNGEEQCDLGDNNGLVDGRYGCTFGCRTPHYCGDGNLDTDRGEECDLGDSNGVPVDQRGNPSNAIDARVQCTAQCTINVGPLGHRLAPRALLP